jgi:hypothetical protein
MERLPCPSGLEMLLMMMMMMYVLLSGRGNRRSVLVDLCYQGELGSLSLVSIWPHVLARGMRHPFQLRPSTLHAPSTLRSAAAFWLMLMLMQMQMLTVGWYASFLL